MQLKSKSIRLNGYGARNWQMPEELHARAERLRSCELLQGVRVRMQWPAAAWHSEERSTAIGSIDTTSPSDAFKIGSNTCMRLMQVQSRECHKCGYGLDTHAGNMNARFGS